MNVAIVGQYCSGKDTVADYLINNFGYKKYALATPIKEIMAKVYGITSKSDPRYRKYAQKIGTDFFRKLDDLTWVNYLMKDIENETSSIVVSDTRFINEAQTFLDNGWTLIYLDCPKKVRIQRAIERDGICDKKTLNHKSEKQVKKIRSKFENHPNFYVIDSTRSKAFVENLVDRDLGLNEKGEINNEY
jgi:dephospho-CoA kinase